MSRSSSAAANNFLQSEGRRFISAANAAMRRAARLVAAENKRLGLPLIVEKPKRASTTGGKRR